MRRSAVAFLGALMLVACSSPSLSNLSPADASPDVARGTPCTSGMVAACPCLGGGQGVQSCDPMSGVFGSCVCPGVDAGTDVPATGSDAQATTDAGADLPILTDMGLGTDLGVDAVSPVDTGVDVPPVDTGVDVPVMICTPGAASCASSTSRQVCNTSGLSYTPSACPVPANASATCASGTCGFACNAGYGNCDGASSDGCESTLATDVNNCGSCGSACVAPANASVLCSSSTCYFICNAGYGDCNGIASDGCESNLATDPNNCGTCGHACGTRTVCSASACVTATPQYLSCPVAGEQGCGVVSVPGGTYTMGGDSVAESDLPAQPSITVSGFTLDAYAVTVARFRRYWAAGHPAPSSASIAYPSGALAWGGPVPVTEPETAATTADCTWSETAGSLEAHPINCVDWWTAQAFCVWDGARLATDAEFEYAARGWAMGALTADRNYPWGPVDPSPTCDRAQWNNCGGDDGTGTRRVGSFAPSGGLYDMVGNVWSWTADWYSAYSGGVCWGGVSLTNPLCSNSASGYHTLRGGSWGILASQIAVMHSATRNDSDASHMDQYIGFRCARSP